MFEKNILNQASAIFVPQIWNVLKCYDFSSSKIFKNLNEQKKRTVLSSIETDQSSKCFHVAPIKRAEISFQNDEIFGKIHIFTTKNYYPKI